MNGIYYYIGHRLNEKRKWKNKKRLRKKFNNNPRRYIDNSLLATLHFYNQMNMLNCRGSKVKMK